jgi:hypothetical protein
MANTRSTTVSKDISLLHQSTTQLMPRHQITTLRIWTIYLCKTELARSIQTKQTALDCPRVLKAVIHRDADQSGLEMDETVVTIGVLFGL